MADFMFQNVAYRASVYRTGIPTVFKVRFRLGIQTKVQIWNQSTLTIVKIKVLLPNCSSLGKKKKLSSVLKNDFKDQNFAIFCDSIYDFGSRFFLQCHIKMAH